jgi:hypothetical protein
MADRLQAIELKNSGRFDGYDNEEEDAGLLASAGRNVAAERVAAVVQRSDEVHRMDEDGIVPIMIEDFLEKNGVM